MIALVLVRTCTGLRRYFVHCTERISDKQSFLYVPRAGSEILDGPDPLSVYMGMAQIIRIEP